MEKNKKPQNKTTIPEKRELTFLDRLLQLPLFIFANIMEMLDYKTVLNIQQVDPELEERCKSYHRLITCYVNEVMYKERKFEFDNDINHITYEEFIQCHFKLKASTIVFEDELTDEALSIFDKCFPKSILASTLHVYKIQCNTDKFANLIKSTGVTEFHLCSDLSKEVAVHPILKQLSSLWVSGVSNFVPELCNQNKFKELSIVFEPTRGDILKSLHQVIKDWINGNREIIHWNVGGCNDMEENSHILFGNIKLLSQDADAANEEQPVIVPIQWYNYYEQLYKVIRKDKGILYIRFGSDSEYSITLTPVYPEEDYSSDYYREIIADIDDENDSFDYDHEEYNGEDDYDNSDDDYNFP